MLNEIFDIIHDLNEDRIIEAASKTLRLVKDVEDENIMKIAAEIEKEIRSMREDDELIYLVDSEYANELKGTIYDLKKAKERKIKILIAYLVRKVSKDNILVVEALKPKTEVKPHTFI
ncbi:hypothetical protein SJAV_23220 [Sulfurisphaera javensis]|uniref:PhoU domain-containing protein n=1 Tax=Sulfurisphaera javensis TaxID=2049879 RepID=A0AAT9GUW2_9CREN